MFYFYRLWIFKRLLTSPKCTEIHKEKIMKENIFADSYSERKRARIIS